MLWICVLVLSTTFFISKLTSGVQGETCSPPQLSDITLDTIFIGRVSFREEVVSELHCMDQCIRQPLCVAYNMETVGSRLQCTVLSDIEETRIKPGSLSRTFDREKIEKFLFQLDSCEP
ncbi:uncharacterized protein LOC111324636 [Stylophora pistillata]|uniref:uncharacterized protein LOC111324636 n=1 Tax=Stylophora pistillata TaxID=50429 RepID=UPI000C049720|nr:uncharacterized protein LOC111324636 [Stylophora pistillata]